MMKDTMYIGQTTKSILSEIFTDNTYAEMMYGEIIDEVVEDVETSADVSFNYSDISLAVQRSILRKMNILV